MQGGSSTMPGDGNMLELSSRQRQAGERGTTHHAWSSRL